VAMWLKTIALVAVCAAMFAAALGLMALGGAVLCCTSQATAVAFWTVPNVVFGILPVLAGVGLIWLAWRSLAMGTVIPVRTALNLPENHVPCCGSRGHQRRIRC